MKDKGCFRKALAYQFIRNPVDLIDSAEIHSVIDKFSLSLRINDSCTAQYG
jgi:hypothetical protein